MIDPLAQALDCIGRGVEERAALQQRVNMLMTDTHQLRRQLERARDRITELDQVVSTLEHRLAVADLRVEQTERATREHAGRTA